MSTVTPLPNRRTLLADERSHGLRATWHPELGQVVLSVWHADHCTGTVRLRPAEAARLATFLTQVVGNLAEQTTPVRQPAAG